jgi:hypothetical protein
VTDPYDFYWLDRGPDEDSAERLFVYLLRSSGVIGAEKKDRKSQTCLLGMFFILQLLNSCNS